MAKTRRNFVGGKMNKDLDERLVPKGQYIHAENIWSGSTEDQNAGSVENSKGNDKLTTLGWLGVSLTAQATTIGSYSDSANNIMYWFVHDPNWVHPLIPTWNTGKIDLIVSYNANTSVLKYHVVSVKSTTPLSLSTNTTLNFNPQYLITGIVLIDDLLFWTDDYNQPRCINVNTNYPIPNPVNGDSFIDRDLLIIKAFPVLAPSIQLIETAGQEDFLEENFICFAYRYKYADGEYSATSQWSLPAFIPSPFDFTTESYLNEGMVNKFNAAIITYNSGPKLVKGIELLFKNADNSIIKVIEQIDKGQAGLVDDTDYTFTFTNSKIFTILPESEILRIFDNVPRLAKALTMMGNRLMLGNYLEGYPLSMPGVDGAKDYNLRLQYVPSLISNPVGLETLDTLVQAENYTIDGSHNVTDGLMFIDLDGFELTAGASITWSFVLEHESFTGTVTPTATNQSIEFTWTYILPTNYNSVYELATSAEFVNAVSSALPVYHPTDPTSCDGFSFTDQQNCQLLTNLNTYTKYASGITADGQGIFIAPMGVLDTQIGISLVAMKYVDDVLAPVDYAYEYYKFTAVQAFFQKISNTTSLHSNRGYEVGIVYMDEFGRSTTALVSPNNTVFVPCANSITQNIIRVTIPTMQIPPPWARRYKWVLKPDREKYETVYCFAAISDPGTNAAYFLLEGENANKVEQGDRLIVKSDSAGPLSTCVYTTVLEKANKEANFITIDDVYVPGGTYMKINPNNFYVDFDTTSIIDYGLKTSTATIANAFVRLGYLVNRKTSTPGIYEDYPVPLGSKIYFDFIFERKGRFGGNANCEKRYYRLTKSFISTANYASFIKWFNGDNIKDFLNDGVSEVGGSGPPINNQFVPNLADPVDGVFPQLPTPQFYAEDTNYYFFYQASSTSKAMLYMTGTKACALGVEKKRASMISARITVHIAENMMVFETQPKEALPDVFYENNESFEIFGGEHLCNVTDQDIPAGIAGVSDLSFYNCYTFGNGVESYKIRDGLTGRSFSLGNRVTTVASTKYGEVRRFADITYSGVYNNETNLNRFNEFNAGLFNFKQLENIFGAIQILDGRKTDILVLQQDKISYVLQGKDLLSDAGGFGTLVSVPEILGKQIARTEMYGISNDPASYVQWGENRYFTDAKRGSVLCLRGEDAPGGQLLIISETGMEFWFRDTFLSNFNTQKLGGYDPYMDKYTLSFNDRDLPSDDVCLACGITQTVNLDASDSLDFCVALGSSVGTVTITYTVVSATQPLTVSATYNGVTVTSGPVTTSGTLTVVKDSNSVNTVDVEVVNGSAAAVIQVNAGCVVAARLTVISVCVSDNIDAGQYIHNEYGYVDGDFVGAIQSAQVQLVGGMSNPLVSQYASVIGDQGQSGFPTNGSDVTLYCNKIGIDNFVFDPSMDKFRYLRSNTLYANTVSDIANLLTASSLVTPINTIGAPQVYSAEFTMPSSGAYLYLIYDYRSSLPVLLCKGSTAIEVCCDCDVCTDECNTYTVIKSSGASLEYEYTICGGALTQATLSSATVQICSQTIPVILSGDGGVRVDNCDCP